jgi:hypothetical protein
MGRGYRKNARVRTIIPGARGDHPENYGKTQAPADGQVPAVPQAPPLPPWWYLGFWVWRRVVVECERSETDRVAMG